MEVTLILVIALIVGGLIWVLVGIKSHQHKGIAILLIFLFLFVIYGIKVSLIDNHVTINSAEDLKDAVGIYFSWLGSIFTNLKTLTTQAISMNWQGNKTAS